MRIPCGHTRNLVFARVAGCCAPRPPRAARSSSAAPWARAATSAAPRAARGDLRPAAARPAGQLHRTAGCERASSAPTAVNRLGDLRRSALAAGSHAGELRPEQVSVSPWDCLSYQLLQLEHPSGLCGMDMYAVFSYHISQSIVHCSMWIFSFLPSGQNFVDLAGSDACLQWERSFANSGLLCSSHLSLTEKTTVPIILVLLLQFVLNQMPFNIANVECLNLDIYMNIFLGVGSLLNWK